MQTVPVSTSDLRTNDYFSYFEIDSLSEVEIKTAEPRGVGSDLRSQIYPCDGQHFKVRKIDSVSPREEAGSWTSLANHLTEIVPEIVLHQGKTEGCSC